MLPLILWKNFFKNTEGAKKEAILEEEQRPHSWPLYSSSSTGT